MIAKSRDKTPMMHYVSSSLPHQAKEGRRITFTTTKMSGSTSWMMTSIFR